MVDREYYDRAVAFEALRVQPAFVELMEWLAAKVRDAEDAAMLAAPGLDTREVRNRFTAWQECRKVQIGIEELFDEWKANKERMDEEIRDERTVERDRSTRNW